MKYFEKNSESRTPEGAGIGGVLGAGFTTRAIHKNKAAIEEAFKPFKELGMSAKNIKRLRAVGTVGQYVGGIGVGAGLGALVGAFIKKNKK